MNRRAILVIGASVVGIVIIAGIVYATYFASTVNQTQTHKAAGAIVVTPTATALPATGTPTSTATATTAMHTFQIVPAQTTASYSVYENLFYLFSNFT